MLVTKIVTKPVETVETVDILCNKCGGTCREIVGRDTDGNPVFDQCGLIEHTLYGGYGSPIFADGAQMTFSLCEKCLDELIKSFKIPAEEGWYF